MGKIFTPIQVRAYGKAAKAQRLLPLLLSNLFTFQHQNSSSALLITGALHYSLYTSTIFTISILFI
ncbi:hypothetical protein BLGI_3297 [Brevibacillus laterosporus GI-9]|nr:hypothetical protein BLGI_3297 [Brevibacillus laterosporus GI-9]